MTAYLEACQELELRYEVRLTAGVFEDHYVVRDLVLHFMTIDEAMNVHTRIMDVIHKDNWEVAQEVLGELFNGECFAGWSPPYYFNYKGVWEVRKRQIASFHNSSL